jgi:hypothetical protein
LTATSATTYQWYLNGQLISGATSQSYTTTVNGIYVVRITDVNGCVYRYSAGYPFTNGTSTAGIIETDFVQWSIFPNPSTGLFTLQGEFLADDFLVNVFNNLGQSVFSLQNSKNLDLSALNNGTYLIQVKTSNNTVSKRISLIK